MDDCCIGDCGDCGDCCGPDCCGPSDCDCGDCCAGFALGACCGSMCCDKDNKSNPLCVIIFAAILITIIAGFILSHQKPKEGKTEPEKSAKSEISGEKEKPTEKVGVLKKAKAVIHELTR